MDASGSAAGCVTAALHMLKLSAGCDCAETLERWQSQRLADYGRVFHRTRMMPRRREELLSGGSIYWVIKGHIQARQRILDLEAVDLENPERGKVERHCLIILEPQLHRTQLKPQRAFQGWRYAKAEEVPVDLRNRMARENDKNRPKGFEEMPQEMLTELTELGLL